MSEAAVDGTDKSVENSNLEPSYVHSNDKTPATYFERIRQYYDRRMPKNRVNSKKQMVNTDVETIPKTPQGKTELDEDDGDDRGIVNTPRPGVDDGFFSNNGGNNNPDAENVPLVPSNPGRTNPPEGEDYPGKNPDSDNNGDDEPDLGRPRIPGPNFPMSPGFGPQWPNYPEKPSNYPGIRPDVESGIPEPLPDINIYQHRKTLAQGMMDLALFSANANQLRYVLESYERHPYYYPSLVLISLSIIFQVAVGIGLICNARYNIKDEREICIANKLNNYTILGIFLITVINVFISAFGVANVTPTAP